MIPLNSDAAVTRFLMCFKVELQKVSEDLVDSTDFEWIAKEPCEIECTEDGIPGKADVFFQTPTTLEDVLKTQIDLSLGRKQVPDLLELVKDSMDNVLEGTIHELDMD